MLQSFSNLKHQTRTMEFESIVHLAGNSNLSKIRHSSKKIYAKSQNWEYFMIFNHWENQKSR